MRMNLFAIFIVTCSLHLHVSAAEPPVYLRMATEPGKDTMVVGEVGHLVFHVDSCYGRQLTRIHCPLTLSYSNERIVGPLVDWVHLEYSPRAVDVFDWITWKTAYSSDVLGPDTTRLLFQHPRDSLTWDTCGELWRMTFRPVDTGTIYVDWLQEDHSAVLCQRGPVPVHWQPIAVRVVASCPVEVAGDLDADGYLSAADILCLTQILYQRSSCVPTCLAAADIDCSGDITTADAIGLVRHQWGVGPPPCDICTAIRAGLWNCR